MKKKSLVLLAALALLLTLFAGCGKQTEQPDASPAPAEDAVSQLDGASDPADTAAPAENQPDVQKPADAQPEEPAPEETQPTEPASAPAELKPEPAPQPKPQPEPTPEPAPEPEGESVRAGDSYTIAVTLEGGSGRATVESPAKLRYDETSKCWATIVWSSPNFDYMIVDGQRYDPINTEGNSTFEILVSAFDQPLTVIADTVAMSEPHEVEYTLTFDYASMEDA